MTGIERIAAERKRQIEEEGFTAEHDDEFDLGHLVDAAICYVMPEEMRNIQIGIRNPTSLINELWPWDACWWNPTPDNRIRELVKAGALVAAEIDRLQRLESKEEEMP
jgi:hypothetical protein